MVYGILRYKIRDKIKNLCIVLVIIFSWSSVTEATHGIHVDSETPGSNRATIFSPIGPLSADDSAAMDYFEDHIRQQQYVVERFVDNTEAQDDNPQTATLTNFLALSGRGVILIITHGGPADLLVEVYHTLNARNVAYDTYINNHVANAAEITKCDGMFDHEGNQIYGICITNIGISNHYVDNDAIVEVAACSAFPLVANFNSREFFSYKERIGCGEIRGDTELLWGRMHGETDAGDHRAAGIAWAAGGFTDSFNYQHKTGKLDTVLSPAIRSIYMQGVPYSANILTIYTPPITIPVIVNFDTRMDKAMPPNTLITLPTNGCNATIQNARWDVNSDYTLLFNLVLISSGMASPTIDSNNAVATPPFFRNNLDGNLKPPIDHIGPNHDDFVWNVLCTTPKGSSGNSGNITTFAGSTTTTTTKGVLAGILLIISILAFRRYI